MLQAHDEVMAATLSGNIFHFLIGSRQPPHTKLCMFYGENHGLSREGKPSNRISRLSEILRWMDEHLKEE